MQAIEGARVGTQRRYLATQLSRRIRPQKWWRSSFAAAKELVLHGRARRTGVTELVDEHRHAACVERLVHSIALGGQSRDLQAETGVMHQTHVLGRVATAKSDAAE